MYETEPLEAANRFAEALTSCQDLFEKEGHAPEVSVQLTDLPVGSRIVSHTITKDHLKPES